MSESIPSSKPESPEARARRFEREAKKRHEALPAAKPRMFRYPETDEEVESSPFLFPPVQLSLTSESVEDLVENNKYTEFELDYLKLGKLLNNLREDPAALGDYEVSCVMRAEGDRNRIDKMIAEIDPDEPWEAGRVEHLLLLAQATPELFDEPVVALGSEAKQTGNIPCLQNIDGRTTYANHPRVAGFNSNYRFLIVRKRV